MFIDCSTRKYCFELKNTLSFGYNVIQPMEAKNAKKYGEIGEKYYFTDNELKTKLHGSASFL